MCAIDSPASATNLASGKLPLLTKPFQSTKGATNQSDSHQDIDKVSEPFRIYVSNDSSSKIERQ